MSVMSTPDTKALAKEFREVADRFQRAADALDPPARKKPGPKPKSTNGRTEVTTLDSSGI